MYFLHSYTNIYTAVYYAYLIIIITVHTLLYAYMCSTGLQSKREWTESFT